MAFNRTYTSSPVLAMPPQAVHPFDKPVLPHQGSSFNQSLPWSQQLTCTSRFAGRKRSRDEAAVNLDPPEKTVEPPVLIEEEDEDEDEWVYGPGMTLMKKNCCYITDAGSQSGTWIEEQAAEEEARKKDAALLAQEQLSQERPSLRSNKSQRLDMTTTPLAPSDGPRSNRSSPARDTANPLATPADALFQPVVDDFTLHLGIGWSGISEDEHIQAAARGWSRYIENHYPVTDAKIRLESRGLQSYLVEANEGYFLFAENLRQGRLVSKDAQRALQNLKSSPPVFDSPETMDAIESPKPIDSFVASTTNDSSPTAVPSMDVDMS